MGFISFLEELFGDKNEISLNAYSAQDSTSSGKSLWAYRLALNIVTERYGALLSKCEFKTYVDGEEFKGDNYYLLNYEPNPNQSAAEFRKQLVRRLIFSCNHDALIVPLQRGAKDTSLYIADSFSRNGMAIYGASFTNVTINTNGNTLTLDRTFRSDECIYMQFHNSDLDAIFSEMRTLYLALIENAQKAGTYRQKYALTMDQTAEAQASFEEHMQELLDEQFNAFINGDNAVIPLYAGMDLKQTSAGADLGQNSSIANKSIDAQIDEIIVKVGLAFNIPRSVMLGDYESDDLLQMLVFCIDPLAELITQSFNRAWYGKHVLTGSFCRLDTAKARHFDMVTISEIANKVVSSGVYTINDIHRQAGDPLIDPKIGDVHFVTRNYAVIGNYLDDPDAHIEAGQKGDN